MFETRPYSIAAEKTSDTTIAWTRGSEILDVRSRSVRLRRADGSPAFVSAPASPPRSRIRTTSGGEQRRGERLRGSLRRASRNGRRRRGSSSTYRRISRRNCAFRRAPGRRIVARVDRNWSGRAPFHRERRPARGWLWRPIHGRRRHRLPCGRRREEARPLCRRPVRETERCAPEARASPPRR